MPTEDAYSSGHLVLSHFGTCMCSNVETNLSLTCLVSGLLNFEHPSVLLFCSLLKTSNKENGWGELCISSYSLNILQWVCIDFKLHSENSYMYEYCSFIGIQKYLNVWNNCLIWLINEIFSHRYMIFAFRWKDFTLHHGTFNSTRAILKWVYWSSYKTNNEKSKSEILLILMATLRQ